MEKPKYHEILKPVKELSQIAIEFVMDKVLGDPISEIYNNMQVKAQEQVRAMFEHREG